MVSITKVHKAYLYGDMIFFLIKCLLTKELVKQSERQGSRSKKSLMACTEKQGLIIFA